MSNLMLQKTPLAQRLIAVVEDDRAVLNSLEFALQAGGFGVCGFEQALEARDSDIIMDADCLVVDYAMPGLTGIDLLRELRGRGLKCPAIIIASNPKPGCRRDAQAAGAPLVEKPLMGDDLIDQIRASIASSRKRRR